MKAGVLGQLPVEPMTTNLTHRKSITWMLLARASLQNGLRRGVVELKGMEKPGKVLQATA
ncbi:hypothetical protein HPP92_012730 [Vanilla planifolia]|uniref:Uncharacterized protein n=1 Tax=Vanilla planifolia TaxID=51239 RepID=A0A835QTM5_VANPL|nr:hypothetical protein HPP92_012730 [Vanilla planifolia]